jgi:hypothetical protein
VVLLEGVLEPAAVGAAWVSIVEALERNGVALLVGRTGSTAVEGTGVNVVLRAGTDTRQGLVLGSPPARIIRVLQLAGVADYDPN